MLIFPAIDLKDGQVVRLRKGDFDTVHRVAEDPVAVAQTFWNAGARYLHMVDLDGARDGVRRNGAIVEAVTQVGLKLELGGGLRSMADLEEVFSLGVWRGILGSAAVNDPDFVRQAVKRFGSERIAVGIDARDGLVCTAGWEHVTRWNALEFAATMEEIGVQYLIFTDIETDGMLTGPSFEKLAALQERVACRITASGGISSHQDLHALSDMGLYAAIVGKAWYAGRIDVARAVREGGAQL